jgi:hypothetical protein
VRVQLARPFGPAAPTPPRSEAYAHSNNIMHTGPGTTDGLIKLVGTLGVHLTDFV